MRLPLAISLALALTAAGAAGQTADVPVMGTSAEQDQQASAQDEKPATEILVLGDAIGGGLGAGLSRLGEASGRYDVTIRFNEESGLARPEVYDWASTVSKILETSSYDVIVVMLGANDRQMIRSGNLRLAFNSPGWISAYKAQVDQLLDVLAKSNARVYWVAEPPMADADYDAAMKVVSDIQRERVEARGMNFVDLRRELSAPDGSYTDSGPDDTGQMKKLRGRDGVSFFKAGNNRMGQLVLQVLESGTANPLDKTAKTAVPDKAVPQPEAKVAKPAPVFGQMTMAGEDFTLVPEGVTANAVLLAGAGYAPSEALQAVRGMAPAGSDAEKLFKLGDAGQAPKGRADDFTVLPPKTD